MNNREHVHKLLDLLPGDEIAAAEQYLSFLLIDPVSRALAMAPYDDEPETEEERKAVQQALDDPGPDISHDEVLREFGM